LDNSFTHQPFERWVNYLFFDLTCEYGAAPGRALIIAGGFAFICTLIYILAQYFPGQKGGIWVVWDEHRIDKTEGSDVPRRLTAGFPSAQDQGWMRRTVSISLLAIYFSVLSMLRIGWHELNVGTWLSRLQFREYSLRATGWVRFVSGLQSLISIYLVVLVILTYFETPFE
jgi:hypothetical protein